MGKSAKVVADEPAVDAGHSMSLAVAPNIQLELEISDAVGDNSHRIGSYRVMGPAREWHMLEQACDVNLADETLHVRGALSSIQPITMPPEMHEAAGVADGATHFAFAYPAQYAVARKEAEGRDPFPASFYEALGLVRVGPVAWQIATSKRAGGKGKLPSLPPLKRPGPAAAIKSPAQLEGGAAPGDSSAGLSALSAPGGANERPLWGSTPEPTLIFREIDKRLAALNLADETWAFLLLVGGFLFFDSERRLISVSALTLVPSIWQIHLDGPFTPSRAALHGLRAEGKLQAVTLDALVESGCAAFGWSHAGEAPGGHRLDEDLATKIEHGCFVYEMKGAPPTYFCIAPHTTDELAKFSEEMEMLQEHRSKGPPGMDRALSLSALTQPMSVREIMEGKPLVALLGGMVGGANTLVGGAQRAMAQAEREVKEMNKLTTEMGDAEGNRLAGRWGLQLRRILIVVLGALPVLAILTSLAYLDGYAYELLACFVWNACNTWVSWVPLRDTSAIAVRFDFNNVVGGGGGARTRAAVRFARFQFVQFLTPLLLTAIYGAARWSWGRHNSSTLVESLGKLLVNLSLPLMIFWLRWRVGVESEPESISTPRSSAKRDAAAASSAGASSTFSAAPAAGTRLRVKAPTPGSTPRDGGTPRDAALPPTNTPRSYSSNLAISTANQALAPTPPASPPSPSSLSPSPSSPSSPSPLSPSPSARTRSFKLPPLAPTQEARFPLGSLPVSPLVSPPSSPPPASPPASRASPPPLPPPPPLGVRSPRSLVVASFDTQLEAATRLQAQTRGLRERRRVRAELAERRRRMHQFSWPMLLATMIDLIGNSVVSDMMHRAGGFEQSAALWSLAFALPGTFIIVYDLRRDDRPRFSLAHGIFFVGVLFRVGSKAVVINTYVWDYLTDYFTRSSGELGSIVGAAGVPLTYDATVAIAVSLLTMTVHILIFICVTTFGKLTLDMVATPNACPHLIFPFQFFDYVFLYSFFNLRDIGSITASWVLTQVLVQVNVILRNSGTNDAIMQNYFGRFFRLLLCQRAQDSLKEFDPNLDPLIRLQFLARVGWQFDLADVAALIATPAIVTLLVWRDGYYTLEGTDILVRACDLYNVWLRFGILLVIKPAASGIARLWLRRKMRKTLLGKRTMHGTSRIAAQIVAERRLKMGHSGKGKGRNVDEKVLDHFDFKEEELAAVREELSFSTLNFSVLRAKSMKKWRYYLSVIILQLFSAFPCRRSVPNGLSGQWQDPGTGARSVAVEMSMLPLSSSWFYVPHNMAPALSATLNRTLYSTAKDPTDLFACKLGQTAYKGWPSRWAEPGDSRSVATSIEQADKVLNSLEDSVEIDARLASPVWKQYLLPKVQAAPQDDDIIHVVAGAVVYAVLAIAVLVLVWFTLRLCLRSSAKVAPKSNGSPRQQSK